MPELRLSAPTSDLPFMNLACLTKSIMTSDRFQYLLPNQEIHIFKVSCEKLIVDNFNNSNSQKRKNLATLGIPTHGSVGLEEQGYMNSDT